MSKKEEETGPACVAPLCGQLMPADPSGGHLAVLGLLLK